MPPVQSRLPHPIVVRCFSLAALTLSSASASAQCQPVPTAKLYPTHPGNEGTFFDPIAFNGDWLFIPNGLHNAPDGGVGIVYTYHRDPNGKWTPGPELTDPGKSGAINFGTSLAIDGDTAAVGMFSYFDLVSPGAFVFQRGPDNSWTPGARLLPTGPFACTNVDVDGLVGDTILISASAVDNDGQRAGGIYTFRRNGEGRWSQEARLMAFGPETPYARGSISGDRIIIGTSQNDGSPALLSMYKRNAGGVWEAGDPIVLPDADGLTAADAYPILSGSTLAVEAGYYTDNDNFTRLHLYRVRAEGLTFEATVAPGYFFSSPRFTVADGLLLVGRPLDDIGHGQYSGAVDVYARTGDQWALATTFAPPDAGPQDRFGWPLMLDSGTAAIISQEDKQDNLDGSAYIYDVGSCGPCAPDCNDDGDLDLFDFLCYFNAFDAGDSYANRDGNETIDLFDVLLYVNTFNAGC